MTIDPIKIAKVKTSMDNRYEESVNKKTTITGSYSGDTDSYPTILACINKFGELVTSWAVSPADTSYPSEKLVKDSLDLKEDLSNKVTSWIGTVTDTKYPSAKLVKDSLDDKLDAELSAANRFVVTGNDKKVTVQETLGNITLDGKIGSTSGLLVVTDNSGELNTSNTLITIAEKSTANTGALKTYQLKINGTAVTGSTDIDIPKDYLLQSASIETVGSTPTQEETEDGLVTGDKYLKLVVNTSLSETGATILRIKLTDFIDTYTADETSLTLSNANVFSIKAKGVTKAKLADEVSAQWISDADDEINQALDDLAEAISPTVNNNSP